MNQSQFVEEVMNVLFSKDEFDWDALKDDKNFASNTYELALGMIKQKYEQKKVYSRRPSLRETQAMQAYNRGGY
jgi:hypothetical protein